MRVSEIAGLTIRDLDPERDVIRIINGKGNKDREIDFTDGIK